VQGRGVEMGIAGCESICGGGGGGVGGVRRVSPGYGWGVDLGERL